MSDDPYVHRVMEKHQRRAEMGLQKYGVTLARHDYSLHQWLSHLQEELFDAAVYIERLLDMDESEQISQLASTQDRLASLHKLVSRAHYRWSTVDGALRQAAKDGRAIQPDEAERLANMANEGNEIVKGQ